MASVQLCCIQTMEHCELVATEGAKWRGGYERDGQGEGGREGGRECEGVVYKQWSNVCQQQLKG